MLQAAEKTSRNIYTVYDLDELKELIFKYNHNLSALDQTTEMQLSILEIISSPIIRNIKFYDGKEPKILLGNCPVTLQMLARENVFRMELERVAGRECRYDLAVLHKSLRR